mgnify:CR=1 FL=1
MVVPNPIAKIQKISVSHEEYSENQRKHYREHMQFVFTFIPNPRSTLVDVAEEIVKRIELDPQKFIEFRVPIYILENLIIPLSLFIHDNLLVENAVGPVKIHNPILI